MAYNDTRHVSWWLTAFRKRAEHEAEVLCHEITTTLGLALVDVCRVLNLGDEQTRIVIGETAYRAIADQTIPFAVTQEVDRVRQTEAS